MVVKQYIKNLLRSPAVVKHIDRAQESQYHIQFLYQWTNYLKLN